MISFSFFICWLALRPGGVADCKAASSEVLSVLSEDGVPSLCKG